MRLLCEPRVDLERSIQKVVEAGVFYNNEVFFFNYYFLLYNIVLVLPYINMHPSRVPSHLPPHIIPLGHPSAPAPSFLYPALNLDWRFVSYMRGWWI